MRIPLLLILFAVSAGAAEPKRVAVVTKEGRFTGTMSIDAVEVDVGGRPTKVPWADVARVQFGEHEAVKRRQGKAAKGAVRVDGWTLKLADGGEKALARDQLRFIVPHVPLPAKIEKNQFMRATTANGMTYQVRVPAKYDAPKGLPALVMLHGSNANSADYLLGITQRWPKVAGDYVLIGVDGEWPVLRDPDGPAAHNYTYVNFVGKSKYKGFPGTDRESPALMAEAIAEIRTHLKLTKVFVAGHSQGGFLAYSCLMNYPDVFDGAMPIAAGLIFQCEPSAYEDAALRALQRKRPIAILHGDADPLVPVSMGRSAHEAFLRGGFPMLTMLEVKGVGHAFIAMRFEEGVRWMESMTADDAKTLLASAERSVGAKEYRDALSYLARAKDLGADAAKLEASRDKVEAAATAPAEKLLAAIRKNEGNAWVAEFDAFRRQFEFADAAAPVMAEYESLRKQHEPQAVKLWNDARAKFRRGDKDAAYRACEEIVAKFYASEQYGYARRTLAERK